MSRIRSSRPDSESDNSRPSSRPSRAAAAQSNSNSAISGADEPRSRIIRGDNGEIVEFRYETGESYKVNEATYIQTQRSDVPYLITKITDIKVTKAGHAEFVTRPFHRTDDLPYHIYQKLHHERLSEFSGNEKILQRLEQNSFVKRELFICDAEDIQREIVTQNQMRFHCKILYYKSLEEAVEKFDETVENTFFYILGFNPQKRVIVCQTDREVERVRQIHHWTAAERGKYNQSKYIPRCEPFPVYTVEEATAPDDEFETLTWKPGVADNDLVMYLRAARSMAAFAGMCDGGPTDACVTATRDATTLNAIDILTQCNGKVDLALEKLCQNPMPIIPQRMWCEDDTKAFIKGLKQYGKDFFYIYKEYLPHKSTEELIEFYYLWKKTPEGLQSRAGYRRAPKRSMYNSKCPREQSDNESSEDDNNSIDSQITEHICRNCYSRTSTDWHHGGQSGVMLCGDCRVYYKKYGFDKVILDRPPTPPELVRLREEQNQKATLEDDIKYEEEHETMMAVESDPKTELDQPIMTKPEPESVQPKIEPKIEPKMATSHIQAESLEGNTGYVTIPTETIPPKIENERPPGAQEIKRQNNASFDPTEPAVKKPKHEEIIFKTEEKPIIPTPIQQTPAQPTQLTNRPPTLSREIMSPTNHNSHPKDKVTVFAFGGSNATSAGQNAPTTDQPTHKQTFMANTPTTITPTQGLINGSSEIQESKPVSDSAQPTQPSSTQPPAGAIQHLIQSPRIGAPGFQRAPPTVQQPPTQPATSPATPLQPKLPLTHQQPVPSQPERTILGQPRVGVEPGPRPEPDGEHPFGPMEYDQRSKSPQPIRTSVKYQANPGSNANGQNKARFVRNWEYPDGNSCARTDLLFSRETEDPPVHRRPVPQPDPRPVQRPVQPQVRPREQPMIHRPPRNRSNGSIQSQDPYRRPPSSHLTPPTVARQPQPTNPGRITPQARTFPTNPLRPGPGTHSPGQYQTVPGMPNVSLPSHLHGAADLAQTQQALFHAHQQAYLQQMQIDRHAALTAQHQLEAIRRQEALRNEDAARQAHLIGQLPGNAALGNAALSVQILEQQRLIQEEVSRRQGGMGAHASIGANLNGLSDPLLRLQQDRLLSDLTRSQQFMGSGVSSPGSFMPDPRIFQYRPPGPPK